jgi:hypothetical protein
MSNFISPVFNKTWNTKSLKIPKGGNQNPYTEEEHNDQKKKY